MMEYVKVWTAFEDDEWIQSLSCNQRGLFLQLLIFGKRAGGLGVISGRSYSAMALRSGLDDSTCAKFLRKFANDGKIELTVSPNRVIKIVISNYEFWQGLKGEKGVHEKVSERRKLREDSPKIRRINKSQANKSQSKPSNMSADADGELCQSVIDDLNLVAGKKFSVTPAHSKLIMARTREGATLEDFRYVHRVKVAEWGKNPKMHRYIRPKTLYAGDNFDGYRNEPMISRALSDLSEAGQKTAIAAQEFINDYTGR